MQEKWEKFAYIKKFYYLCTRFLRRRYKELRNYEGKVDKYRG